MLLYLISQRNAAALRSRGGDSDPDQCRPGITKQRRLFSFSVFQNAFWNASLTLMKITVFWDVAPCSMVEVYRRFTGVYCLHHQGDETSVYLYQTTRRNIPEDSLHTRRHENMKSHQAG
jgi:hypothetical protein